MYFDIKAVRLSNVRSGFVAGCKEAGIQYGREGGFVFHDLRHTAKTIARMAGVDKNVRMVIFGHSDPNPDKPELTIEDLWYRFALSFLFKIDKA